MSRSVFAGAGQEAGVELWRVERKLLVKQAAVNGKFCTDDVYVVLVTVVDKNNITTHNLYIWFGADSSLNETDIAVQKASDLSGFLDNSCVPVREEQGTESKRFLDVFKTVGGLKLVSRSKIPKRDEIKLKENSHNLNTSRSESKHSNTNADDSVSRSQQPTSILKRLIKEAIVAFPSDAHLKVLEFFEGIDGLDEERALLLRQCWSKVLLGTQAFGRKTQSGGIVNPDLFADELIRELSYADKEVSRLISLSTHYANSSVSSSVSTTPDNARDILKDLQQFNTIDRQLTATTVGIFSPQVALSGLTTDDRNLHIETSIVLFRNSLKGTKLTFKANKSVASAVNPLNCRLMGQPDILAGSLVLSKATANEHSTHRELPLFLSTTELIGVRVTSAQPSTQDLAWSTYRSLNDLLVCQSLAMFPLPVGAQRDGTLPGSTVFAFEALSARPLSALFGPVMSTYLRKHPSVVLLWCGQLVSAYRALRDSCCGRLISGGDLSDVCVRENGMLLLSNVAFSDSASDDGRKVAVDSFLDTAVHLLSSALCLSRCEEVVLRSASELVSSDDGDSQRLVNDVTVSVVAGSTLELVVMGHHCSSVRVLAQQQQQQQRQEEEDLQLDPSELSVRVESAGSATAVVSHNPSSSAVFVLARSPLANDSVFVHTSSSGVVTLTLSALNDPAASHGDVSSEEHMFSAGPAVLSSNRGRSQSSRVSVCTVRVVIVPRYPVPSVALLELVGYLEEYHKMDRSRGAQSGELDLGPEMVLNAQCCSESYLKKLGESITLENTELQHKFKGVAGESNLQREWTEIIRAIERLDVKSASN